MDMQCICRAGVCLILTIIGWEDIKGKRISNKSLWYLLIVVLADVWVHKAGLSDIIIGMLIVSIPMLLLTVLWPGCFGGGDIKLMFICGILLGGKGILRSAWLSLCLASVYCIGLLLAGEGKKAEFALGPFICSGVGIVLLEIF